MRPSIYRKWRRRRKREWLSERGKEGEREGGREDIYLSKKFLHLRFSFRFFGELFDLFSELRFHDNAIVIQFEHADDLSIVFKGEEIRILLLEQRLAEERIRRFDDSLKLIRPCFRSLLTIPKISKNSI